MTIDFANLHRQYRRYQAEIDAAMQRVVDASAFIMGPDVAALETELSAFVGAEHAITCSSGTDALLLAMMALGIGPGDEVVTTPFTFIATAETIAFLGARPVFADVDEHTFNLDPSRLEAVITERTRAIIPVSLYGQPCDMDEINAIALRHGISVIEDGAQSFGATYRDRRSGNLCDIGCTSFFPAKPLGCFGDGGAVFTSDAGLAETIRSLRVHGQSKRYHHRYIGMGGRLDTLQAAVLRVKLGHYADDLARRQATAEAYRERLSSANAVVPNVQPDRTSAWAQFSLRVQNRDALQTSLKARGIPTAVHYPMPLHRQEAFAYLGHAPGDFPVAEMLSREVLSLPMNPDMTEAEIDYVCRTFLELDA